MKLKTIIIITLFSFKCSAQIPNDSLILSTKMILELRTMFDNDQKYRTIISDSPKLSKKVKDSLWNLQTIIDKKNTIRLIEIITEKGFIHSGSSNCNVPVFVIFMHSSLEFKSKIKELITRAKKNNRIDDASFGLVSWHINGRKEIQVNGRKRGL